MELPNFYSLGFDTSRSACRGADSRLFFPDNTSKGNGAKVNHEKAKAICDSCAVKDPCLEYSVRYEPTGFWGGKTEVEREVIRVRRNIQLPVDRPKPDTVKRASRYGRIRRMALEGDDR